MQRTSIFTLSLLPSHFSMEANNKLTNDFGQQRNKNNKTEKETLTEELVPNRCFQVRIDTDSVWSECPVCSLPLLIFMRLPPLLSYLSRYEHTQTFFVFFFVDYSFSPL